MRILEVKSSKDFKRFLQFPMSLHEKTSRFVPPLFFHTKMMIGKIGTPNKHLFLALDEHDQILGRIGCKIHEYQGEKTLNFGFFECRPNHKEVAKSLIDHCHKLYPSLLMRGPYHFRMEDPFIGVLVEGFEHDPYFLMSYNPPYYDEYLSSAGLYSAMDLYTYDVDATGGLPEEIAEKAAEAKKEGFTIRYLDKSKMREEVKSVMRIFNEALSDNWGFEEFLESQINDMYMEFKFFLDHRIVAFAQHEGKDVAAIILLPNYNPLISDAKGRLSLKTLWRFLTQKKKINSARGYALGVLKDFHSKGVGSLLVESVWHKAVSLGYTHGEISWVLSSNKSMNGLATTLNGEPNKKYRIYERKALNGGDLS